MHATEKILAAHCGRDRVSAGEIVVCDVDFAEINDLYLQTVYSFYEMGGKRVANPDKVAFVFDHYAPAPTLKSAENHEEMRRFAKENGFTHHFDIDKGVCHQVMPEAGVVYPGMILVATDSHTTTHGAFGAFGTGCGATDMACILLTGQMWFRVPEVIEIRVEGTPSPGTAAKDVVLYILGKIRADGAVYKAIDFKGSYIEGLGVADRMTICNMAVEMGAKTAYMQPNQAVLDYVRSHGAPEFTVYETDPDFEYAERHVFDVNGLEPQLSCPSSVENVHPLAEVIQEEVKIDQGYLGSCTNGRLQDLEVAAKILKGKHIAPGVRMVVVPASAEVLREAIERGIITDLLLAGATLQAPGCAACLGTHAGIIGEGEVCVSSTNRNFPGRMGSRDAKIYLASPATVAASCLTGRITDPRPYLEGGSDE